LEIEENVNKLLETYFLSLDKYEDKINSLQSLNNEVVENKIKVRHLRGDDE
jgi:hypothetical protein